MSKLSRLWQSAPSRAKRARQSIKEGVGVGLGLLMAAGAIAAPIQAQAASNLRVETKEGPVKGFLKDGVAEFLGIPYAEPPVGDLRWKPPQKRASWTNVLQATSYGPTCAQITTLGVFAGPANNNEDCLYLNVFSPDVDAAAKEKLPVIVWIHGGGLVDGESNDYDASKLAAQGHTVVVTINYRLSLLGYLAHPALDAEGHAFGNYGLMDQQLALKWVKRNIVEFGGDKNNVTLGGQSAGATSAGANVLSSASAGLFDRAIYESGGYASLAPLPFAESKGAAFSVAAGCGSGAPKAVAKCLRGLTAERIMALSGTQSANGPYITGLIADGQLLPQSAIAAYKNGQFNHVPIINGTVEDEGNFSIGITEFFSGPPRTPITEAQFNTFVATTYSGNAGPGVSPPTYPAGTVDKVLARYPLGAYASPQLALDAVMTDVSACRSHHVNQVLADQVAIYAYEFDDRTAPYYFPKMPGFVSLAYHTSDIQYLFPLYHGGSEGIPHDLNNKQENLSAELVAAWTNFARTGNPNSQGNAPWPRYKNKPAQASYLSENIPVLSTFADNEFSTAHKCGFWDQVLVY
jgi:para-nitrobenzyl esterase